MSDVTNSEPENQTQTPVVPEAAHPSANTEPRPDAVEQSNTGEQTEAPAAA